MGPFWKIWFMTEDVEAVGYVVFGKKKVAKVAFSGNTVIEEDVAVKEVLVDLKDLERC